MPVALQHSQQATCTAPWYVQGSEYHPVEATYQPLINGEETFEAVHLAIAKATKTVDIICWGFQPSMFFIRDGKHPSIGDLLKTKAREGVNVRVLGWEMPLNAAGLADEANLPGKGTVRIQDRALQSSTRPNTTRIAAGLPTARSRTVKLRNRRRRGFRCSSAEVST